MLYVIENTCGKLLERPSSAARLVESIAKESGVARPNMNGGIFYSVLHAKMGTEASCLDCFLEYSKRLQKVEAQCNEWL